MLSLTEAATLLNVSRQTVLTVVIHKLGMHRTGIALCNSSGDDFIFPKSELASVKNHLSSNN